MINVRVETTRVTVDPSTLGSAIRAANLSSNTYHSTVSTKRANSLVILDPWRIFRHACSYARGVSSAPPYSLTHLLIVILRDVGLWTLRALCTAVCLSLSARVINNTTVYKQCLNFRLWIFFCFSLCPRCLRPTIFDEILDGGTLRWETVSTCFLLFARLREDRWIAMKWNLSVDRRITMPGDATPRQRHRCHNYH